MAGKEVFKNTGFQRITREHAYPILDDLLLHLQNAVNQLLIIGINDQLVFLVIRDVIIVPVSSRSSRRGSM
jgi:hypothetical protein